jgi:hypothetical protein
MLKPSPQADSKCREISLHFSTLGTRDRAVPTSDFVVILITNGYASVKTLIILQTQKESQPRKPLSVRNCFYSNICIFNY